MSKFFFADAADSILMRLSYKDDRSEARNRGDVGERNVDGERGRGYLVGSVDC